MVDTTTAPGRGTGQQLERRRADLVGSREQLAAGRLTLAELQGRADALRGSRDDTKRRLAEAEQLVQRLQGELKKNTKERSRLERQIKADQRSLVELDRRAVSREQKYDRAVLADLVEREKARDLAVTPAAAPVVTPAAEAAQDEPADTVSQRTEKTTQPSSAAAVTTPAATKPTPAATRATPATKPTPAVTRATPAAARPAPAATKPAPAASKPAPATTKSGPAAS